LTLSREFSEAVYPHHDRRESTLPQYTDGSSAPANNENHNPIVRSSSTWRQATPFRSNHRSTQESREHEQPPLASAKADTSTGLRITAPARLFTIQSNPYTANETNKATSICPYQHEYSDRAIAAQERRQLRRQLHAQEEAAFYDAQQAKQEFDEYRKIAAQSDVLTRIQAYRVLCGYDETTVAANGNGAAQFISKDPPKGWYVLQR
jgi:hypothetical protein